MTISLSSSRLGNIQSPAGPTRIAHAVFSGRVSQSIPKIQFGNKPEKPSLWGDQILINPLTWLFAALLGTALGALSVPRSNPDMEKPQQVEVSPLP